MKMIISGRIVTNVNTYREEKEEFKKKTGIVLTKLVMRIQEMMPEIQMEKTGRRFAKHTIMMGSDKTNSTSQVEE